jgi:hypothetical protein
MLDLLEYVGFSGGRYATQTNSFYTSIAILVYIIIDSCIRQEYIVIGPVFDV